MRTVSLALLLAVAALIAGGCGADDASKAKSTVSTLVSGVAKGDDAKACAQLTPAAQRKLLRVLRTGPLGLASIRASDCRDAIVKLHAALPKVFRNVLVDGEVDNAKVTGDKATVHVVGAGMTAELQKIDGKWLVTGGLFQ
ncbi:MAG: hypothetical protein QOJ85_1979 [Solirubrobacteraceae bacterium]|nr:hypothetical protein [Solirubrobacteraceae bacterium]